MSSLGAGGSQTKTVSVTIPSVGYYYVTVFCDGFQAITESNENNNIGSTYPSRISIGGVKYTLTASVSPSGSGSVSLNPPGGTYDEGTQVTLTANPASGYTLDHWGGDASGTSSSITITMNSNKSVIAYFTAIQKADLTVTSVSAPSSAKVGDSISVTFTVKNQGGSSSGSFSNRVSLSTSSYGTTYSLGNFSMSSLGAGGSQTKTVSVTIPSVSPGYYYVTVFTDGFQAISESNENNNIGSTYPNTIYVEPGPTPTILYNPPSFSFSATEGGSNPSSQTLSIRNSGRGTLNWSVSDDVAWLSLTPTRGTSTGETDSVAVSVSISGMNAGSYSAIITISASEATNTPQKMQVSLTISPAALAISDQQKQQEMLNMVTRYSGAVPQELILAIIRQEGGRGAFYTKGWQYNSFYRESNSPWAQPTNGDGITQVTTASGYHERSGSYTHDQDGYAHAIKDACDYLLELYGHYGSYVQATLHYNSGPYTLYIYLGRDWGDRDYLSHVAEHLTSFVPPLYGLRNDSLAQALREGQAILNDYLYDRGIASGKSVDYYKPYQAQLDRDLHSIGLAERINVAALSVAVVPSGGGSISLNPAGGTYDEGTQVTLTASPASGYTFDHWGGDTSGTNSSITITMDSGKSVIAYFTEVLPVIGASPSALFFEAVEGGTNPPRKTLSIWNAGEGSLSWEVTVDVAWLTVSPTTGISAGETDKIAVSVDITGMDAGDYNSTISISAKGATNLSRIVPVSLSISPQPVASALSDLTVTLVDAPSEGIVGQNISVTFVVENRGNDASGPFHSMVALSPKSKPWGMEMYLADITMDSIPPDKSKRVTVDVTVPPSLSSPSYYVTVFADAFEKALESNEGNNIGSTYPQTIAVTSETSTIADLITSIATGGVPVTVDGELYFILTLENRIDPITLEVVPDSGVTKVYVYGDRNYPVSDKEIVQKICVVDKARRWMERAGSMSSILQDLDNMRSAREAHESLTGWKFASNMLTKAVAAYITTGQSLTVQVVSGAVETIVSLGTDPARIREWLAYESFSKAEEEYQEVLNILESGYITDYDTASTYFEHLFKAHAYNYPAVNLLLQTKELNKSWLDDLGDMVNSFAKELVPGGNLLTPLENLGRHVDQLPSILQYKEDRNKLHPGYLKAVLFKPNVAARYTLELARIPRIDFEVHSPVELRVYDSQGRVTGIVNGEERNEIPYSAYYENTVTIFSPTDSYRLEISGTGDGSYDVSVTRVVGQEVNKFTTAKVPTSLGATHLLTVDWDALSRERDKLPLRVDSDGDGRFEDIVHLSGPGAKGLPPWVWLVIGVVIGFAIAFGVWRSMDKKQVAKR